MTEIAVNVPFDANEIKQIVTEELRKRLDSLGPLQGAKEYASFDIGFNVTIRLRRTADTTVVKDTLAWGNVERGEINEPLPPDQQQDMVAANSTYSSGDPNDERVKRGMPLTVEANDGKGGKIRKQVTVKE